MTSISHSDAAAKTMALDQIEEDAAGRDNVRSVFCGILRELFRPIGERDALGNLHAERCKAVVEVVSPSHVFFLMVKSQ